MSRRSTVGVEVEWSANFVRRKNSNKITYKDMAIERPQAGLAIIWRSI